MTGRLSDDLVWVSEVGAPWDRRRSVTVWSVDEGFEWLLTTESSELWDLLYDQLLSILRRDIVAHPERWRWELLAERFGVPIRDLQVDDWFLFDDYYTEVDHHLAHPPMEASAFPRIVAWVEGTDLEALSTLKSEHVYYRDEAASDHELSDFPLGRLGVSKLAHDYGVEALEDVVKLVSRLLGLAPHRSHVAPSGLILRQPNARQRALR